MTNSWRGYSPGSPPGFAPMVRGLHTNPRGLVVAYTSDAGSAAITTNKNRTEGLRLSWQHLYPADRPPVRNNMYYVAPETPMMSSVIVDCPDLAPPPNILNKSTPMLPRLFTSHSLSVPCSLPPPIHMRMCCFSCPYA